MGRASAVPTYHPLTPARIVDTRDGAVRVIVQEVMTGRTVYQQRYTPVTARRLAEQLTLGAYRAETGRELNTNLDWEDGDE